MPRKPSWDIEDDARLESSRKPSFDSRALFASSGKRASKSAGLPAWDRPLVGRRDPDIIETRESLRRLASFEDAGIPGFGNDRRKLEARLKRLLAEHERGVKLRRKEHDLTSRRRRAAKKGASP